MNLCSWVRLIQCETCTWMQCWSSYSNLEPARARPLEPGQLGLALWILEIRAQALIRLFDLIGLELKLGFGSVLYKNRAWAQIGSVYIHYLLTSIRSALTRRSLLSNGSPQRKLRHTAKASLTVSTIQKLNCKQKYGSSAWLYVP